MIPMGTPRRMRMLTLTVQDNAAMGSRAILRRLGWVHGARVANVVAGNIANVALTKPLLLSRSWITTCRPCFNA